MPNYKCFHVNYYLKVTCNILLTMNFLGCFEYFNFKNLSTYMVSFSWTFCKLSFYHWLEFWLWKRILHVNKLTWKYNVFMSMTWKCCFSSEKRNNSTREIKNENNGRRIVICTWIAAITARIVTQAILFS